MDKHDGMIIWETKRFSLTTTTATTIITITTTIIVVVIIITIFIIPRKCIEWETMKETDNKSRPYINASDIIDVMIECW